MALPKTKIIAGIIPASLHLGLVGLVYGINITSGEGYAPILWFFLAVIDLPVSLGLSWNGLEIAGNYEWNNQVLPLLYLGSVGTIWWFLLGTFFHHLISRLRRCFQAERP